MIEGTKELKMHRARRLSFLRNVERSTTTQQKDQKSGQIVFSAASSWGQVLFFILTGFIILVLPRFQALDPKALVGYTIVLFQMMAPLEVLLTAIPGLSRGTVAIQTVEELGLLLEAEELAPEEEEVRTPAATWELLELEAGRPHLPAGERRELPARTDRPDLPSRRAGLHGRRQRQRQDHPGKLLIGLYAAGGGADPPGRPRRSTTDNRERYRQIFSVVFSDFFLSTTCSAWTSPGLDRRRPRTWSGCSWTARCGWRRAVFSTLALSQGQRKRLALLTAYLEDRPIYLFDEWAADQDPQFKEVFYLEILPELRGARQDGLRHQPRRPLLPCRGPHHQAGLRSG